MFAFVVIKLLPPRVNDKLVAELVRVPVKVKLLPNVIIIDELVVILFQVIPLVFKVVLAAMFRVELVVVTVPAV